MKLTKQQEVNFKQRERILDLMDGILEAQLRNSESQIDDPFTYLKKMFRKIFRNNIR